MPSSGWRRGEHRERAHILDRRFRRIQLVAAFEQIDEQVDHRYRPHAPGLLTVSSFVKRGWPQTVPIVDRQAPAAAHCDHFVVLHFLARVIVQRQQAALLKERT